MEIVITSDEKGGETILTTDSPLSQYNVPVLEIDTEDIQGSYGPADMIAITPSGILLAAYVVAAWAEKAERSFIERELANRFLSQWPNGPQIASQRSV